ncbi:hypothetical protein CR513_38941, partial [Mucuna pruriens]
MSSSETVEQYFSRVTNLVNKMRVYGEDIPESKVVEKILRTMPMKFDHVVTTIVEAHDTNTMTVAELQGSIEVSKILEKTEKANEEALKSQQNPAKVKIVELVKVEIEISEVEVVVISNEDVIIISINNGEITISGHLIKEEVDTISDLPTVEEEEATTPKKEQISTATTEKFEHIAVDCRLRQQENIAENQYQHTSCSNHMCGKKELFSSLNEMVKSTVKFGNNTNILILGKGRIAIKLKDGSQNFISDVFYAPGLHHNLLSMGQLSEKGYNMQILDGCCTLIDKNGRFIAK